MIRCLTSLLGWLLIVTPLSAFADEWQAIEPLPDLEGFAGSYAGVSHDALLVAGGANFPDKKPAQGGTKVWYDRVFVLESPAGKWKSVGKLPRPLGYGVSVSYRESVVCVGGSDSQQHYADVFQLQWHQGELRTTKLPSFPHPIANACGAIVGDALYVVGGQMEPTSSQALTATWRLNLSSKESTWQAMPDLPASGRILAVAAASADRLWVAGGAALHSDTSGKVARTYLVDAYCFDEANGWQRITNLPHAVTAAASPAPSFANGFYVLGGDDGTQVGIDIARHQGFSNRILHYDSRQARWTDQGEIPAPRVTLPCVRWNEAWVLPSGEMLPGVRSPQVWTWTRGSMNE